MSSYENIVLDNVRVIFRLVFIAVKQVRYNKLRQSAYRAVVTASCGAKLTVLLHICLKLSHESEYRNHLIWR